MKTQPASTPKTFFGSAVGRLAVFAVGILLLTGCQAGWGATAEQQTPETPIVTAPGATAPGAREAAAPDPG